MWEAQGVIPSHYKFFIIIIFEINKIFNFLSIKIIQVFSEPTVFRFISELKAY